ncbi:hypothetical protein ACTQ49_03010 [Luteococcus sp. Sow4_B9]|uniref:hypothetical protein n=1 Tax=Luteococcus sp. Sow4_B9 TaxID=3438792 RepID=UPI003F97755E
MSTRHLTSGEALWLRYQKVHVGLVCALLGLLVVHVGFGALTRMADCQDPECRANVSYWAPVVVVASLGISLRPESALERVAAYSPVRRRTILLSAVTVMAILATSLPVLSAPTEFGAAAAIRNVLGFVGLLLLGHSATRGRSAWVPFIVLILLTAFYSWGGHPTVAETIWGFPRQPGGVSTPDGLVDLSWPTALTIYAVGTARYLASVSASSRQARRGSLAQRFQQGRSGQASTLPIIALLGIIGTVKLFSTSSRWAGDLGALIPHAITGEWLAMVPVSAAIGAWAGQTRWRSGTAQFDVIAARGVPARWWSFARYGLLALVTGHAMILALCVTATLVSNARIGVGVAETWATVPNAGTLVPYYTVLAATCLVASMVGFTLRARWVTPLVALGVYVLQFLLMPTGLLVARYTAPTYDLREYSACTGDFPRVCARPVDAAYLPAGHAMVAEVYAGSPFKQSLPGLVLLANDAGFADKVATVIGTPPRGLAVVSLDHNRSFGSTKQFDRFAALNDLRTSVGAGCPVTLDQRASIPVLDDPQADREWGLSYLAAIRDCDQARMSRLQR